MPEYFYVVPMLEPESVIGMNTDECILKVILWTYNATTIYNFLSYIKELPYPNIFF